MENFKINFLGCSCSHLCVWEGRNMDAVFYEDGLNLCFKLSSSTQDPHTVAVGIERRVFPWINAHHNSVVLREDEKMDRNKTALKISPLQSHEVKQWSQTGARQKLMQPCAIYSIIGFEMIPSEMGGQSVAFFKKWRESQSAISLQMKGVKLIITWNLFVIIWHLAVINWEKDQTCGRLHTFIHIKQKWILNTFRVQAGIHRFETAIPQQRVL